MGLWGKEGRKKPFNYFTGKPYPPQPPPQEPKPSVLVDAENMMEIGQFIVKELAKSKDNKGKTFELNIHIYPK
jgi:hypothetical protein